MAKGTAEDWGASVRNAQKGKTATVTAEDREVTLSVRVPASLRHGLDELRLRRTKERGQRVTMAGLVAEAVRDLLKRHA